MTRGPGELAAELADIEAAQRGDLRAAMRLVDRYRPLLRKTVGKARLARALQPADAEDLHADLIVDLLEAVRDFDPAKGRGLAAVLPLRFAGVVSASIAPIIGIPRSTLNRYYDVLKSAEGVADVAARIAPGMGMSTDTFWSVYGALRTDTPDAAVESPWSPGGYLRPAPREGQSEMVDRALAVLTDVQREVIERAYGFRELGAHSDGWVADEMGRSPSYIKKVRLAALAKMRAELGAEMAEVLA